MNDCKSEKKDQRTAEAIAKLKEALEADPEGVQARIERFLANAKVDRANRLSRKRLRGQCRT
jgi:hypothetical protein